MQQLPDKREMNSPTLQGKVTCKSSWSSHRLLLRPPLLYSTYESPGNSASSSLFGLHWETVRRKEPSPTWWYQTSAKVVPIYLYCPTRYKPTFKLYGWFLHLENTNLDLLTSAPWPYVSRANHVISCNDDAACILAFCYKTCKRRIRMYQNQ